MKTLDGLPYTFNGAGEFVLLQDIRKTFTTQVRLEQVEDKIGRISEQESLFSYPFGKSYASYMNSDFRPNFNITPVNKIDNYTREICKDDMNCIYDLQTTGITDIAVSTMEAMDEFLAVEKSFQKKEDGNIVGLGKLAIYATIGGVAFIGLLLILCVAWNCRVNRNKKKNEKV
ncbi:hypothetical protein KUTeg_022709 [Tegillarca granosa]|uniref:Mucin-4-like C8-3 domain-containing protein n=1 Tax=Tegillarca granosa TaxID=220873 RepID=A0ABQ9E3A9_TEGGR|nr:hypothetical protein KUTeg_022709 [Tegillarca granosa]